MTRSVLSRAEIIEYAGFDE